MDPSDNKQSLLNQLEEEKVSHLCGIKLRANVSPINMIAFYIMIFISFMSLNFILSFVTFILSDPEYYNLPSEGLGAEMGKIGSIAELCMLVAQPLTGLAFDTVGRKVPVFLGMLMVGLSFLLIPLGRNLYPQFLLLRTLLSFGTIVGLNAPLLPDYVQGPFIGRAYAINQLVISSAFIFSSTGLMQIGKHV